MPVKNVANMRMTRIQKLLAQRVTKRREMAWKMRRSAERAAKEFARKLNER
tara:strand:- start:216 stop:368 length:153 start_codon:yes stop_codon:yes gene_type:complete